MRVRFAPSPTGNLHIGSLRTALFNWFYAKHHHATFIVRIEDTDRQRSTTDFEKNILSGLAWMGLDYDEGPDKPGPYGPYRQSERVCDHCYDPHINTLIKKGLAYHCFCSPDALAKEKVDAKNQHKAYMYSGKCRALTTEQVDQQLAKKIPYTLRFAMPTHELMFTDLIRGDITFDLSLVSDFVLVKSDGTPSYNFAVVADDIDMKISHVLRGEDHISNTPKQLVLFHALTDTVPQFGHFPIILGSDRTKLSKRHGATAIREYEQQGFLPDALLNYLALLGWSPANGDERLDAAAIVAQFSLERISKAGAMFDRQKLTWLNRQYIRDLSASQLTHAIQPFLSEKDYHQLTTQFTERQFHQALYSIQENLDTLADSATYLSVYLNTTVSMQDQLACIDWTSAQKEVLCQFKKRIDGEGQALAPSDIKQHLLDIKKSLDLPTKTVFKTVRLAISGQESGPDLTTYLSLQTPETLLNRLAIHL